MQHALIIVGHQRVDDITKLLCKDVCNVIHPIYFCEDDISPEIIVKRYDCKGYLLTDAEFTMFDYRNIYTDDLEVLPGIYYKDTCTDEVIRVNSIGEDTSGDLMVVYTKTDQPVYQVTVSKMYDFQRKFTVMV